MNSAMRANFKIVFIEKSTDGSREQYTSSTEKQCKYAMLAQKRYQNST